jgi:hypothetical protein
MSKLTHSTDEGMEAVELAAIARGDSDGPGHPSDVFDRLSDGQITPDQAAEELARLRNDRSWWERLFA